MPDQKVTVILPDEAVKTLDDIVEETLTGSRGRAIQHLMREHRDSKRLLKEQTDKINKIIEEYALHKPGDKRQ